MKFKLPFLGERKVEGPPNAGVSLSTGVEVTLLFKLELVTSDKMFADLDRSMRGFLTERFPGDPLLDPG